MSSDKALWLKRLGDLDQEHAPDLPPHISLDDLTSEELRTLVERAQRRHRNSTVPALRPSHTTTILIRLVADSTCVKVKDMELLPGGALLLVHLENDLQCWTVPGGECVWSYSSDTRYEKKGMNVCSFAYDMQTNGAVHVLVMTGFTDKRVRERTVTIFTISPHEKSACQSDTSLLCRTLKSFWKKPTEPIYKCTPKELEKTNELLVVWFAKLSGDVLSISVGNDLLVTFWKEDRSVLIRGCLCNDVHFVDGYLIGAFGRQENRSIIAFRLSSIRNVRSRTSAPGATQILTLECDIPYSSCRIPGILGDYWHEAKLSICTFHWKPEAKRKQKGISITMSIDKYNQKTKQFFSVLDSFLLEIPADTAGPNTRLSSIKHVERPGTVILDPKTRPKNSVCRPSQAGSVVIHSSDPLTADDRREDLWTLATISSKGKLEYRTLSMPHADIAKVEFYSGALYFATKVSHFATEQPIIIQYLD